MSEFITQSKCYSVNVSGLEHIHTPDVYVSWVAEQVPTMGS